MDPIGFALDNFDAVGSWRTEDAGQPINAHGKLIDGTEVDESYRSGIPARQTEVFISTVTARS